MDERTQIARTYMIMPTLQAMIDNSDKITSVTPYGHSIFFIYKNKYRFAMLLKEEKNFELHLFKADHIPFEELKYYEGYEDENTWRFVFKSGSDTMSLYWELYEELELKCFGLGEMLGDICKR